ncbi:MAG: hypothetical protein WBM53_02410 [Maribacter sp.]
MKNQIIYQVYIYAFLTLINAIIAPLCHLIRKLDDEFTENTDDNPLISMKKVIL